MKGGRCEACQGEGFIEIEMQFLPDVTVPCEVCKGSRYNREALEIKFKGKNIAEVLDLTVEQALEFFEHFPGIQRKAGNFERCRTGLYSSGAAGADSFRRRSPESQTGYRIIPAFHRKTLYILDEPTTGLSFEDVAALLRVLQRLTDAGNTVIVIEHNLDVIKNADYIIDLGPGAGDSGGYVIATGTPEEVAKQAESATGQYLARSFAAAASRG